MGERLDAFSRERQAATSSELKTGEGATVNHIRQRQARRDQDRDLVQRQNCSGW